MKTVTKIVVLDVDGVILRHPPTFHKVYKRIESYVAKTVRLSQSDGASVNSVLYKQFGHTHLGLQKMYSNKSTLDAFNNFVYTDEILNSIHNSVYNVDMLHHLIDLQHFLEKCKENNIPIYMFSNAPYTWCSQVQTVCNLHNWIPSENIITCDHDIFAKSIAPLKPQPIVYKTVQDYLSFQHGNPDLQIVYVDDALCNLVPIVDAPRWTPVWFGADTPSLESHKVHQLSSFRGFWV